MNRCKRLVASFVMLSLALAPTALAAKSGGKGTNSTSITGAIALSAGPYNFGGSVSATTAVAANLMPWISMSCTQDGAVVGTATHAGFAGGSYFDSPFNLGPSTVWTAGAANCALHRPSSGQREGRHRRERHDSRRRLSDARVVKTTG